MTAHFRAHFGREHRLSRFAMWNIVEGRPRFAYGGYNFALACRRGPWDGIYTDDVYIDLIDGEYYSTLPAHPGVRIAKSDRTLISIA